MNEDFSPVLKRQMEYYNGDPSADKITKVKGELEEVKGVMVENIEKVLERGEKIELLVDKTDRLNQTAFKFEKTSKQLKDVSFIIKHSTFLSHFALPRNPMPPLTCNLSEIPEGYVLAQY